MKALRIILCFLFVISCLAPVWGQAGQDIVSAYQQKR